MRSKPRFPLTTKVSLAAASMLLALVLAEGVFRLLSRERVELHGLYSRDPVVGVGLTPHFRGSMRTSEFDYRVEINELGMRDHAVGAKRPGLTRILVLGDSFVFGVGVDLEETLPKALQRQLNEAPGAGTVEVFNGGVPGYSPFQEVYTLRRLAPAVEPDFVVLVLFVGDDWFGNAPRIPPEEARKNVRERLSIHSSLFRAFDRFVLARLKGRDQYDIHRRQPDGDFERRMREVLNLLQEARAVATDRGAAFLVALCPRYTQVYDRAWAKAALVYRLDDDEHSLFEPNRRFGELLSADGFWHVDLLPPMREEVRDRLLHFPVDGHWNVDGNAFVAAILAATIRPWLEQPATPIDRADTAPGASPS